MVEKEEGEDKGYNFLRIPRKINHALDSIVKIFPVGSARTMNGAWAGSEEKSYSF